MSATRAVALAVALVACAACYHTQAPPPWLGTPLDAASETYGGWAIIRMHGTLIDRQGELLEVTQDTLHIFEDNRWTAIPRVDIASGFVERVRLDYNPLVTWTLAGMASTLSNGWWLIFGVPTWIIAGTASASSVSKAQRVSVNSVELNLYARYPQGLPLGTDRANVKARFP